MLDENVLDDDVLDEDVLDKDAFGEMYLEPDAVLSTSIPSNPLNIFVMNSVINVVDGSRPMQKTSPPVISAK